MVGYNVKKNDAFRKEVYQKISDNAEKVAENHPSNEEFSMMMKNMDNCHCALNKSLESLHKDVREIRNKL